jgi:uncharacterized peroxidase-related enzyme
MANIKVIQHQEATGRLKTIYDDLLETRGQLAEVHMIQSLRPESIVKHMDLYMEIMYAKSELSRAEREMMAVVVSSANQCIYCQTHHGSALNKYWKDDEKVQVLRTNYHSLDLSEKHMALCDYAWKLTKNPEKANDNNLIKQLKTIGLSDSACLDATLVIAYFNFVNRIVLGHQIGLEPNNGRGYKY